MNAMWYDRQQQQDNKVKGDMQLKVYKLMAVSMTWEYFVWLIFVADYEGVDECVGRSDGL